MSPAAKAWACHASPYNAQGRLEAESGCSIVVPNVRYVVFSQQVREKGTTMAGCDGTKKTAVTNTIFMGGPFDTEIEAQNAIRDGLKMVTATQAVCNGDCDDDDDC